ncbi:Aluminum-activated malate transporter 10 [Citrus sinensis]|uniref:Aluminum-activated malate transporter 10 n=1 Tax=Citrus sinensis TaxID=2711 RepID=A0ACB8MPR1_CITSI|nr:Aluminum-activated malate transporter 10 [Citrus sinensis]KAH9787384.1 Aluminum-activated malate transporter 10 [Citrus sinensis]
MGKEASRKLEWRINVSDGVSERLEPETGAILRAWTWFKRLMLGGFILKICKFLEKAWNLAVDEPKKVIHGLKVGLAISLVSLFYYMRPLYDGVGGNAMWAVMTVVVVFESSVGATLGKCINRAIGTFLAGSLGVGVHWIAFHSGKNLEPIVLGISLFLLGDELHLLICQNLEKLAHSLDECVVEYFRHNKTSTAKDEACSKKMKGYRCALNSKATEELKANFARWEPAHGRFSFRHPWKQYLKIGASIRNCAYCIETLHGCVDSETQAPPHLKRHLNNICMRLSSSSSNVLQELAFALKTMKQSSKINLSVGEMNFAVQELKHALISLPNHNISIKNPSPSTVEASGNCNTEPITSIRASSSFMEILPLATLASLLIENAAKIEVIVNGVNELAVLAEFKPTTDNKKSKSNQSPKKLTSENQDPETVKIPQKV